MKKYTLFSNEESAKNNNPAFNKDMLRYLFTFLTPRERVCVRQVNKDWRLFLDTDEVLWKSAGAEDYQDFVTRTQTLEEALQFVVLEEICTLAEAEKISPILKFPEAERFSRLPQELQQQITSANLSYRYLEQLWAEFGIIALCLELITPEQAAEMPTNHYLKVLLTEWGIKALQAELITPEQASAIKHSSFLKVLLSKSGIKALQAELITPEQTLAMKSTCYLEALLSKGGIKALQEKLITPEQASAMKASAYLMLLLTVWGIKALQAKLITLEQISAMKNTSYLEALLSEWGMKALGNKAFTTDEAINMKLNDLKDKIIAFKDSQMNDVHGTASTSIEAPGDGTASDDDNNNNNTRKSFEL